MEGTGVGGSPDARTGFGFCRSLHAFTWAALFSCLVLCSASRTAQAQNASATEHQIKAAFLYNFARFIEWPKDAFLNESDPFVIGVLGPDPFVESLDETIRSKVANGRALIVKRFKQGEAIRNCHILYLGDVGKEMQEKTIRALRGAPVLTVSDGADFVQAGGVVGFFIGEGKVRFVINADVMEENGLRSSAKLMAVAKVYRK